MKHAFDNECRQWIADVYHCSDTWGEKQTQKSMLCMLREVEKEKDPDDFSPHPSLYRQCAAYWNELCIAYPN